MAKSVWVCAACGKVASNRNDLGDVSCIVNAIECEKDSVVYNEEGRATQVTPIEREEAE